mgnify:CR=1 FL=1
MTTLTIKIDERSKKGKAFLEFAKTFFNEGKEVEIVAPVSKKKKVESPYNPEFVKMVLDAEKRGNYTTLDPDDIWGSLGLK